MRFKNDADYEKVVDIFGRLKFPISNAGNTGTPAAPMRPLRPAPASLIQNPPFSHIRYQSSISEVTKNYETRASNALNDASYALPRPLLTEESPFFRRSHTASSETARPGSSLSLDGPRASDTASSMSFREPLVRPNSVLDYVRPVSSLSASQFETEVCIYFLKCSFLISLHPFNFANCFRCVSQSCTICNVLENYSS
jgi:hypothetical protein